MSGTRLRLAAVLLLAPCAGCVQDMWDGVRLKPLSGSAVFADGRSARPLEPDTVARGTRTDDRITTTASNGVETDTLPFPLTASILDRGQQRYEAYCAECHGYTGYGDGIVVRRGYPSPPSYHTDRLRNAPLGHYHDVITNGYGIMYPYNDRVRPADRWAIAAYIRALQLSQNASLADIPTGVSPSPLPSPPALSSSGIPDADLTGAPLNGLKGVKP